MLDEFRGIMIEQGDSVPPRVIASKDFVREVRDEFGLTDDDAVRAADWVVGKMERYSAYFARPVFDMKGQGPQCSACGAFWPLCGHARFSGVLDEEEETE